MASPIDTEESKALQQLEARLAELLTPQYFEIVAEFANAVALVIHDSHGLLEPAGKRDLRNRIHRLDRMILKIEKLHERGKR